MMLGGFEAKAFGVDIPLAPSLSVQGDVDMFRARHKDCPFGIGCGDEGAALSASSATAVLGGVVGTLLMVKEGFPINFDSIGEASAAATSPITGEDLYPPFTLAEWDEADVQLHSVLAAALNIEFKWTNKFQIPKPPAPGFPIWPPFITARINIALKFNIGWHSSTNKLRGEVESALEANLPTGMYDSHQVRFDRYHEPLQDSDASLEPHLP